MCCCCCLQSLFCSNLFSKKGRNGRNERTLFQCHLLRLLRRHTVGSQRGFTGYVTQPALETSRGAPTVESLQKCDKRRKITGCTQQSHPSLGSRVGSRCCTLQYRGGCNSMTLVIASDSSIQNYCHPPLPPPRPFTLRLLRYRIVAQTSIKYIEKYNIREVFFFSSFLFSTPLEQLLFELFDSFVL